MASRPDVPAIAGPDAAAKERGYEARDVRAGIIAVLLVGFGLLFAGLCGGLWLLYRHEKQQDLTGLPVSAVSASTVHGDAPPLQPQLSHESLDAWDLAKMRDQEESVFKTMGWVRDDRTHRFDVPAEIVGRLQRRYATNATTRPSSLATTRPAGGGS